MATTTTGTSAPQAGDGPKYYARKATGMVREIPVVDMVVFNAASSGPVAGNLAWGLFFAMVAFPRANMLLALAICLVLVPPVWAAYALLAATMPKVGGDFVYNSRILHPAIGLGANVAAFFSAITGAVLQSIWLVTFGLVPLFTIVGIVSGQDWWTTAAGTIGGKGWTFAIASLAIVLIGALSVMGTRKVLRVMSWSYVLGLIAFVVALLVLLFTSRKGFVADINAFAAPLGGGKDFYDHTIDSATKSGLALPGDSGYSTRSTLGAVFIGLQAMIWPFWGTYMAGEMKGGGRRSRQLTTILSAGWGQGLLLLIGTAIVFKTVGYDFVAAANGPQYTLSASPYYTTFAGIASSDVLAVLIDLLLLGVFLPAAYINLAMCQRAPFSWAFDGVGPKWLAAVSPRTHTPVRSIAVVTVIAIAVTAWAAFGSSFFTVLAVTGLLGYTSIAITGVSATILRWRRPELYRGTPAEWKWGGVHLLPLLGVGCVVVAVLAIVLDISFRKELGVGQLSWFIALPVLCLALGAVGYAVAAKVQRGRGINLSLNYKTIPPD